MTMPPIDGENVSALTFSGIQDALKTDAPSQADVSTTISSPPPLPELDASLLQCTYVAPDNLQPIPSLSDPSLTQQRQSTDHMIQAKWNSTSGWSAPTLCAFAPLTLSPMASCLHYATQCFEGMKVYRGHDGKLRLFRPERNCERLLKSTTRIALPAFPPEEVLKLIAALCATDAKRWLPADQPGRFLYIRPTMLGTEAAVGVQRPNEALLCIFLAVLPVLDAGSGPGIKLLASQADMVRAWPGGFGWAKVGANYGPSLVAQGEARRRGFDQILWLYGEEGVVTEAGASNFFVVWRTRESEGGKLQLVTARLDEGIVLDGVTRRSVIELAREKLPGSSSSDRDRDGDGSGLEAVEVVERMFTMQEIADAAGEGRLLEAFVSGTAWFIAPVASIHFRGQDIVVPGKGVYTGFLKRCLTGIMWGCDGWQAHEWGFVVDEEKVV
ncbi:branched-chain-amino-acid aminotransferas-like protein [Massarina eburnea CBS 473.64]|uniref:Branched-chain-amino-acid aminotransferas-like protein n=1 Tax=Massarina eburnea CBS 473.64 TaxID=1395130 RepID=A0A6A6S5L1_9PLEO|nr:branched-chain-amino-acid aminotransferas-like protein [Massarina eburnea CBS 473.64]